MMQVILSNSKHPEYGQATIPFPLAQDQYEDCVELLEKLEIGDVMERDCKVVEIQGEAGDRQCYQAGLQGSGDQQRISCLETHGNAHRQPGRAGLSCQAIGEL